MLNIVLLEPEIPQNTGNIARTCVAFNATLHLIKPYGFILNDKTVKRSGLDYWKKLNLKEYDNYEEFLFTNNNPKKIYYVTRYGIKKPNDFNYDLVNENIYFVFGKESTGINKNILKSNKNNTIRIPTSNNVRSLNLSNCVCLIAYEAIKQTDFFNLEKTEPFKKNLI